jgi:hypothetical protein
MQTTDSASAPGLVHRWFVQYNPLYLLSAAFVLGGVWLVSRAAAGEGSLLGQLGVAGIVEVYALALIGGAAFLTRMQLRRPAVMLGLLAVLYQCDLTLHVETSAYLGDVGRVAAAVWVVLFVVKLVALAWALELRLSRSALLVPVAGAIGLAVLPQIFREVSPDTRTALVALWVFGVGAAALFTERRIDSAIGYDVRGRRAMLASWGISAILVLGHVLYWSAENGVELAALLPVAALLGTRWARRERIVWAIAIATLACVGVLAPTSISSTALMAAAVLTLRALRAPMRLTPTTVFRAPVEPYRGFAPPPVVEDASVAFVRAPARERERLLVGAGACVYLSVWTFTAPHWPSHVWPLDLGLVIACVLAAWRLRRALPLAPIVVTYAHFAIELGWIVAPRGTMQWGLASIALGFAMLGGSLGITHWLRRRERMEVATDIAGPGLDGGASG